MFLTEAQLHDLLAIVDKHHNAFIANFVGPTVLPPETLAKLQAAGLVNPQVQGIRDAFTFGMVAANLPNGGGPTVSYAQLADRLARNPFPLSEVEQRAISVAQMTAGQFISGLGAKVKVVAGQRVMQVDPEAARTDAQAYRDVTAQAIAERKRLGSVVSDMGHATQEWCRDLERVATTEISNALQQGTAAVAAKTFGPQAKVAKIVRENCCDHCRKLLTNPDGKPKIFLLSELQNNGTNYGKKASAWQATVGPIHPSCQCSTQSVPPGLEFDDNNLLVPIKAGKP